MKIAVCDDSREDRGELRKLLETCGKDKGGINLYLCGLRGCRGGSEWEKGRNIKMMEVFAAL